MAVELELLLPNTSTDQFAIDEATGVYVVFIPQAPCVLEMGCTYTVYWDGVKYEGLAAQDVSEAAQSPNSVAIGNITTMGGTGNNEPFAVLYLGAANAACLYSITDGEHSITIYKEIITEEPEPEPEPDIVLKDYNGEDMFFSGVEKVALENTEGEMVFFSKGDTLENIDIELDFTNGNQTVEAPKGYLVKGATIQKPETLVPENIAKDVTVAGIVGTHAGGGGGDTDISYPEWIDDICFWDIDGTLIEHISLADIKNLASLPEVPQKNGLTFVGWNFTLDELKNVDYPRDVGAMYTPTDGKTHIKLSITNSSDLTVPLNYLQTVDGGVTISWGDGSTSTPTGTSVSTTHKYSKTGNYEIVLTVASGNTLTLGGGTSATSLVGSSSNYQRYITEIHVANGVELNAYALAFLSNCKYVILPTTIQHIPNNNLYSCSYNCKSCIIPNSVISTGNSVVYNLYNNPAGAQVNGVPICLPDSIETIGTYFFYGCHSTRRCILPKNITSLPNGSVGNLYRCVKVFYPDTITTAGDSVLNQMRSLQRIKLPTALQTIGASCLQYGCSIREFVLPNGLVSTGNNFAQYVYSVDKIIIPETFIVNTSNKIMPSAYYIGDIILKNANMFSTNTGAYINRIFALKPLETAYYTSTLNVGEVFLLGETVGEIIYSTFGRSYIVYVRDELVNDYKTKYQSLHSADYPHSNVYPISQYTGKLPPEVEEALKQ